MLNAWQTQKIIQISNSKILRQATARYKDKSMGDVGDAEGCTLPGVRRCLREMSVGTSD